jgi:hypothetical protein
MDEQYIGAEGSESKDSTPFQDACLKSNTSIKPAGKDTVRRTPASLFRYLRTFTDVLESCTMQKDGWMDKKRRTYLILNFFRGNFSLKILFKTLLFNKLLDLTASPASNKHCEILVPFFDTYISLQ